MSEKSTKSKRTWHAGKPIKKPNYDPETVTNEILSVVAELYSQSPQPTLQQIVAALPEYHLNPIKTRKLLITAGVYKSGIADKVNSLKEDGKTMEEIMETLNLSKASVHSYLPYSKIIYKLDETPSGERSTNADRQQLYRNRKKVLDKFHKDMTCDNLWNAIIAFSGYEFKTSKGLKFTYTVLITKHPNKKFGSVPGEFGGEIKVDRKEKTITRATVERAFEKAVEMDGTVDGPKKLGVYGASYLYAVFIRFGVIRAVG